MSGSEKGDWLTPPWVLDCVGRVDRIDLDPCASSEKKWQFAARNYTLKDDGLALPWFGGYDGLVFVNPPYSEGIVKRWAVKAVEEVKRDNEIVLLLPAYLERHWWTKVLYPAFDSCCYLGRRVVFIDPDTGEPGGSSGWFPSVVVYLGDRAKVFEKAFAGQGFFIRPVGR